MPRPAGSPPVAFRALRGVAASLPALFYLAGCGGGGDDPPVAAAEAGAGRPVASATAAVPGGASPAAAVPGGAPMAAAAPMPSAATAAASRTLRLSWQPSTDPRAVGYRVYYGFGPRDFLQPPGGGLYVGGATEAALTGLPPGLWFFAATAVTADGEEGGLSNVAVAVVAP